MALDILSNNGLKQVTGPGCDALRKNTEFFTQQCGGQTLGESAWIIGRQGMSDIVLASRYSRGDTTRQKS